MTKTSTSWKSVWVYLKSQIKFWNLKVYLKSKKVLSRLKIYFKAGPCRVVPCGCIQVYHVIRLNTHIDGLCRVHVRNKFSDGIFIFFRFQNLIWDFIVIETDFEDIEDFGIRLNHSFRNVNKVIYCIEKYNLMVQIMLRSCSEKINIYESKLSEKNPVNFRKNARQFQWKEFFEWRN